METEFLKNLTVRDLRRVCKENGKKNYAWKRKVELIFLIQGVSPECGNCEKKLTHDQMNNYLNDPSSYSGVNWFDEGVPCCAECLEYGIDPCFRCDELHIHAGLEEARTPDTGETLYICRLCSLCYKCHCNVETIDDENWKDDNLYCDDCL